jgi:predicted phosphodiesterase
MQLNSQNKKILVFSDPHQDHVKLNNILTKENYDVAVCLGDWFDSYFYNTGSDVEKTCQILKKYIFNDNFYTIGGNHDWQYLYNNKPAICSGYTNWKDKLITFHLEKKLPLIRDKFLHYVLIDDNILLTHAGIHPNHILPKTDITNKKYLINYLEREIFLTKLSLESGGSYWTYRAGYARGGSQKFGGWCWLDWDEEFSPIDGLKQIVGHTFRQDYKIQEKQGNYCLDTNMSQYILIFNGKVEIKNYSDL